MLTELIHRLTHFFGRRRFENDLDAEMEFHLQTRADELEASGMTRSAALVQARREFGPGARMHEETREAWRFQWIEDLGADLRYAVRGIRRSPGFAATAIACLALGIGANTTIFSVAQEALMSQPSARDPRSLIYVRVGGMSHAAMPDYRFLRDAGAVEQLAGENAESQMNWRSGDTTSRLYTVQVTDNYFDVTGVPLTMGRGIQPGEADTVVASWRFWQRRLGADPDVLGRKLVLDGRPYTIVGVLTQGHRTMLGRGLAPDLYVPVPNDNASVSLYARLAPGMSRQAARSRIAAAVQELDRVLPRQHPRSRDIRLSDAGGLGRLTGEGGFLPVAAFFGMMMVVVTLVLLIACANVASLLLARASSRAQELAIRISIGAGRGRVVRQLLAESLLLGLCGAAAGLWINLAAVAALGRLDLPLPIPIHIDIHTDWRLLSYAAAVGMASSLIAGLAPAFHGARSGVAAALKRDQRQVGGAWNLRNTLVAGQLAVSIVLLCAGFIFLRNLAETTGTKPGFDIDRTVWASMRLAASNAAPEKVAAISDLALAKLRAVPGVQAAALVRGVPMNEEISVGAGVRAEGKTDAIHVMWYQNDVSPDYFATMGIPILAGRTFERTDREAVILNENFARRLFGNADAVGRVIDTEPLGRVTVVGVARNSSYMSFSDANKLAVYLPYGNSKLPGAHRAGELEFLVRTAGPPEAARSSIRVALDSLDPTSAVETRAMANALTMALLPSQAGAVVLGSVGLLGLGLASVGLYGVLLYTVSRRIREIGLRVALGASRPAILKLVLRHSVGLVGTGLLAGIAISVLAVRPLAMFLLPNVKPTDPLNFLVVAAVLCVVAVVATVAPAVRALRVDPLTALRHE
jgi:predicted permease